MATPTEATETYLAGLRAAPRIVHIGNPILRSVAEAVENVSDESSGLQALLEQTLKDYRNATGFGRGLAAPQIGIPKRAFIVMNEGYQLFVNPEITGVSGDPVLFRESCLSCGHFSCDVRRPGSVKLRWQDHLGFVKHEPFSGFMARIIQHELNHLDGILCVDIAEPRSLQLRTEDPLAETFRPVP